MANAFFWRQFSKCLAVLTAAAVSYLLISHFFVRSVEVVGLSMQPALRNGQRCLLNLWIFRLRSPRRGEIVVLRDPQDNGCSVKRVVAVSGDSVWLRDGHVYLNGRKFEEPYLPAHTPTYPDPNLREQRLTCGKDQYIVLGDNRNNSTDSRAYGPVPRSRILGLVR